MSTAVTTTSPTPTPPVETPVNKPAWQTFELKRLPSLRDEISIYNFQGFAIHKALRQRVFVIALSTGLGKSICSLLVYMYYRVRFPTTKLIVVTNKSAVQQFRNELDKFFNHALNAVAIHSRMHKMGGRTYADARKAAYDRFGAPQDELKSSIDAIFTGYATFRMDIGRMQFTIPVGQPLKPGEVRKITKSQPGTIGRALHRLQEQDIPYIVIMDEATAFKNPATKTHDAVSRLSACAARVLGLTATLTKGKLEEIYGIYRALGVWMANSVEEFESNYCVVWQNPKEKRQKKIKGYKNIPEFIKLLQPVSIVLRKLDVAPFLPAYTLRIIPVEHSKEQFKLISDVYSGTVDIQQFNNLLQDEDDALDFVPSAEGVFQLPGSDLGELQAEGEEPVNPFALVPDTANVPIDPNIRRTAAFTQAGFIKRALLDFRLVTRRGLSDTSILSPKTAELMRLLTDEFVDEKIVFYVNSRVYLELIERTLKDHADVPKAYKKPLVISGAVKDREGAKLLFETSKEHNIMLINDAGIEAINLQIASVLIVATMPRSGGDMVQLAGRLSRIGSAHSNLLLIYLQTEDSQDEDEYLIINQQMQMMAQVMGEAEKGLLDWEVLKRKATHPLGPDGQPISNEEFAKLSTSRLLFHTRERRAGFYTDKATKAMVEDLQLEEETEDA